MSIRFKLYIGFGIAILLAVAIVGVSLISFNNIRNNLVEVTSVQFQLERLGNDIRYYDSVLTDDVRAYLIDPQDEQAYNNYLVHADALDTALQDARELTTSAEGLQILANIDALNLDLIAIEEQLLADPDIEQAVSLYRGTYGELKTQYAANVEQFFTLQRAELDNQSAALLADVNSTIIFALGAVGVLMLISFVAVFVLSRNISNPLVALTAVASKIARGDLNQQATVTSKDEIGVLGQTINEMSRQLKSFFTTLEAQVAERTRYLATTVEVGNLVTRINTQEELLPTVTDFIQSRFNLYYTQIYLLDETKRFALLRAGTGNVGQQLLGRKHKLDTDGTSLVATAVKSRQSVLVSNTTASEIHLPNPLLPDTKSEVAIPLLVGNEVIGVLDMQAEQVNTFNDENLNVFEAMASQLASALYGARAYSEIQTAIERAERLNQRITSQNWKSYLGSLSEGGQVQYQFDVYGSDTLRLLDDNTSLHDIAQSMQDKQSLSQSVQLGGQSIGRILIHEERERQWTNEERTLVADAAQRLAQAAEQFRAFDETESARKRSATLYTIGQKLSAANSLDDILAAVSTPDIVGDALSTSLFTMELNEAGQPEWIEVAAVYGQSPTQVGERFYLPEFPFSKIWLNSQTTATVVNDIHTDERMDATTRALLEQFGTPALLTMPLTSGRRWVGLLTASWSTPQNFKSAQKELFQSLVSPIATALNNLLLLDQTQKRAVEMETVAQVGTAATSTLDMAQLLQSVTDLTKNQFKLYHTHIYLLDEARENLVLAAGAGEVGKTMQARGHRILFNNARSLVASAARNRRGIVVDDVTQAPDFLPNPLLPDTRCEMAVPMIVGDEVIGVLDAQAAQIARFDKNDVQVFTALASQVAVAVENARAFEREHETVKRLQEIDQLKSQFLANMSHELRTPLNSIIGYAGILAEGAEGELPEEALTDINIIHESGKHLLAIINDILDLAKIEAREMKLRFAPLELPKILDEVVRSGQVLANGKGITLQLVEESPVPNVNADMVRMRQVTWNLVSNALKFTETGSVTVRYGMLNDTEMFVRIEDTGIGIPDDYVNQVFERFRQVDETSTRSAGGTGLGLTITRELIHLHGGEIYVESEFGIGSTFWFRLPIAVLENAPAS